MTTAKKVTTRKKSVKKSSPKKVKNVSLKSFKISPETAPFISFRITDQTVYWSILLILILGLALWILKIQVDISNILDSIKTTI